MRAVVRIVALLLVAVSALAQGQESGVGIELNKLEARDGACRAYLVIENGAGNAFETLKLDLVLFDGDGIIAKRLAVETAPLPTGKTRVKVFDIQGLACGRIERVLLNDVLACQDAGGSRDDCLGLVSVSSRSVPFVR